MLRKTRGGDTVHLIGTQRSGHHHHDHHTKLRIIEANVHKSVALRTYLPQGTTGTNHIQGIRLVLKDACDDQCQVTISNSHFLSSLIETHNLGIRILNSRFTDSFITATSTLDNHIHVRAFLIENSTFSLSKVLQENANVTGLRHRHCHGLQYIYVNGTWNSVDVSSSVLHGDGQSSGCTVSGIALRRVNLKVLKILEVKVSHMFAVLTTDSDSNIQTVYIFNSSFHRNKDGIDLGHRVGLVVVKKSEFRYTGPKIMCEEDSNDCTSAFKGHIHRLTMERCVFENNTACGKLCKGAAVHVVGILYEMSSVSVSQAVANENLQPPSLQMVHSEFINNSVYYSKYCCTPFTLEANRSGAVAVIGHYKMIMIQNSRFVRNSVCEGFGGGVYVSLLDIPPRNTIHRLLPPTIIIDKCAFIENNAFAGGGLMVNRNGSVVSQSSLILIRKSSFIRNFACESGGGVELYHSDISLDQNASLLVQVHSSDFSHNEVKLLGAGFSFKLKLISMAQNSLIRTEIWSCQFSRNEGWMGAGAYLYHSGLSVKSHSSINVEVHDTEFCDNQASQSDGGLSVTFSTISLAENSSVCTIVRNALFSNNSAGYGAGARVSFQTLTLDLHSAVCIEVSDTHFNSNLARGSGAGFHVEGRGDFHHITPTNVTPKMSTFAIIFSKCSFNSNRAISDVGLSIQIEAAPIQSIVTLTVTSCHLMNNHAVLNGAGISIQDSKIHDSAIRFFSASITLEISQCFFRNNTAGLNGGGLYTRMTQQSKILLSHSTFQGNRAAAGAGFYRETHQTSSNLICDSTCNAPSQHTTQISQSTFDENNSTAIFIDRYSFATEITQCQFNDNIGSQSYYAEDINVEGDLTLKNTEVLKNKSHLLGVSVNVQGEARLSNVEVKILKIIGQKQVSSVSTSFYVSPSGDRSLDFQCPLYYQPELSFSGITTRGLSMVMVKCIACTEGYYANHNCRLISHGANSSHIDKHCYHRKEVVEHPDSIEIIEIPVFCHSNIEGECLSCPHGANCSAGVVSLPNYWGHMTAADRLEFHRCPVGYCCNQAPCEGIAQCAAHREGTLCGRCIQGFSESLLSPVCIPDEMCSDTWVIPTFAFWAFMVTWAVIFFDTIPGVAQKSAAKCKKLICSLKTRQNEPNHPKKPESGPEKRESGPERQKRGSKKQESIPESKKIHQTWTDQTAGATPALWGLLKMNRGEKSAVSGSHKYVQIILYYLQDASLMQVHLALDRSTGSPIEKLRNLLQNVSQLAVDLLDLGLKLCPIQGWFPAIKLITKNLTGPLVVFFIFTIYATIKIISFCFQSRKKSIQNFWYPKLAAAVLFCMLLFYQQIASMSFSLVYCIKSDDQWILFIDGTVSCYQPWQIVVFIFVVNWVVAIIPVLMFLPGLLELRLISVTDFFLACLVPGPMLVYWGYRFYRRRLSFHRAYATVWQDKVVSILQQSYVKTTYKDIFPFCWVGFMKIRRLVLVVIFTFVSNLVGRVSLMCFVIIMFLIIHLKTLPYKEFLANEAYTTSLLATLSIGLINVMKASCVEFYLNLQKVSHSLTTLNMITDFIYVYCPVLFIVMALLLFVWRKIKAYVNQGGKPQDDQSKCTD